MPRSAQGNGALAGGLIEVLRSVEFRLGVPAQAVLTHTIIKIRQEPKKPVAGQPYISAVAYREFAYFRGRFQWAFDLSFMPESTAQLLVLLAPAIHYIGKRGGFIQFTGLRRSVVLGTEFTQPLTPGKTYIDSAPGHIASLDDFGPEATHPNPIPATRPSSAKAPPFRSARFLWR